MAIHDATGRFSRAIGDNLFGQIGVVQDFLRRQGAVVGRPEVVERLLRAGNYVLVFPGGARDMERPYLTQRYRVLPHRGFAPGHGGYIKIALRTRSPIVPLAVVGAEEAHVMLANLPPWLARRRACRCSRCCCFPLPLPVKLYIRFGPPIALPGTPADAEGSAGRVDQLNEMVRRRRAAAHRRHGGRRRGVIVTR